VEPQASFGRAVRSVRLERGWTQEQLAAAAGLDRTYVSGLERGVRNPALSSQRRVALALAVDLSELFRLAERLARGD
jgi:transcriptional regulator with XRE-family HTH domain